MVLGLDQIKQYYLEENKAITAMKKEHKKLLMHVHGVDVTEFLTQIEGLENDTKIAIRKRLARSNKDLLADILRPCDKIFNSQGGSKVYRFKADLQSKAFQESISSISEGNSLSQWMQMYFVDKYVVDPNGLFFIEHKDNKPYPTYKSIASIRNYHVTGRKVDWVIFEPVEIKTNGITGKYFRVYDESGDYLYKENSSNIQRVELLNGLSAEFKNPWGYVPAITCSNLINTLTNYKKSSLYEQVELLDEFVRENSIKTITSYHHKFPMFWQFMPVCPSCKGAGYLNDKICPVCHGTKYALKKDVSDVTYLKQPESKDDPTIAPDIAGYVSPPIDALKFMGEELKAMRDMIYFSHWGTVINREDADKTAFEVALNTQPMQDRLNKYTDGLEDTEKQLTNIIAEYSYKGAYDGCSINYGRNYIIKSPNQYLTEYLDEKAKNASQSVLNGKLEMYYNALYANDEYSRTYSIKLMHVEPWCHNTITEVLAWNIKGIESKLYFNDWLSTQTKDDIITKDISKLKEELSAYSIKEYQLKNKDNGINSLQ